MIMGLHSDSPEERDLADRTVRYLESKGRSNVFSAFLYGDDPYHVMSSKFEEEGVDTFAVIPLCISEGKLSIWDMPAAIHLPDNSGSWTMVGEHDVAIRFTTAMGRSPAIADAIADGLGDPEDGTGILVLAYGSDLSQSASTAEYYRDRIQSRGWKAACGYTGRGSPDAEEAARGLLSEGCTEITVVPLFTTFTGKSASKARSILDGMEADIRYTEPVSSLDEFLELIDSKVPEGW